MSDQMQDIAARDREYTLDELSTLANVTPRTVRYYIAEDLLPPPIIGGRNATYSQEHLDRLNAIASLKEMYLPLREIRRRLNTLTAEQMRDPAYLATLSQAVAMDRAMGKRHGRHERRAAMQRMGADAAMQFERHGRRGREHGPGSSLSVSARPDETADMPGEFEAAQTWERFPLGDDAEILIRSSKVKNMGPRLYRTLHRLRHMIELDNEDERNRR